MTMEVDRSEAQMNRTRHLGSCIGTVALIDYLGTTQRRLDGAVRGSVLHEPIGAGHKRVWTPRVIRQLEIALKLADAGPAVKMGKGNPMRPLPSIIDYVVAGPPPPDRGYVWMLADGTISYSPNPPVLAEGDAAVVARYTDLWPDDGPPEVVVDEPEPDDGFVGMDDYDRGENADAPVSYYEGPDSWEEAWS